MPGPVSQTATVNSPFAAAARIAIAENGVERRAQLVAHVGEELRFVLAGDFELAALLLDLAKQPRVLDRQHRLIGEGLEQIDGALREFARLLAPHHERTHDLT